MDSGKGKHLIVIGGGAAGVFCAVNAARMNRSLKVTLLEKTNKLLSKVRISGGGRCNVTHACFEIPEMIPKYPRGSNFLKKAFYQFFTSDTIRWFEERGVLLKTEADGRMFPVTDSSQSIIDCLMKEVNLYHVDIMMNAEVKKIIQKKNCIEVELAGARPISSDFICIASGGYNKSVAFDWIRHLGHTIEDPVPSLFTFNIPDHSIRELMGIVIPEAIVKIPGTKLSEKGPVLITHWGLSGPAVLRLSAWGARELSTREYRFAIAVNWLGNLSETDIRNMFQEFRTATASQKILKRNSFGLPQRFWQFICIQSGITENLRWAELPVKTQNLLIRNLVAYELMVKGKTTFREEFVTAGGIQLGEIDPNSMQSKIVPNLFFAGEVMNVDGITGGFNFQHAWTSGWISAAAISKLAFEIDLPKF